MTAQQIAEALGGRRNGGGWIARCPAHDDRKPSLSISEGADGKVLICCHAGCSQKNVIEILRSSGLWKTEVKSPMAPIQKSTAQMAQAIWNRAIPLEATEAASARLYLSNRGLRVENIPSCLRYVPSLEYFEEGTRSGLYPALIASVVDSTGKFQAIQRIYHVAEGVKAPVREPKMSLGPIKGNAIHFGEPGEELAIAEGPETALAVFQATGIPTWSAISASGVENLQIPPCVKRVHIFGDLDQSKTGEQAAEKLAARLTLEGKTVFIHFPPLPIPEGAKGVDWLDALNALGVEAFEKTLATPKVWVLSTLVSPAHQSQKIKLSSLGDLLKKPDEHVQYLVEGLLPMQGLSILAAKPKVGKTTLTRCLSLAVANGWPFLGRATNKGRVICLSLEEKESEVKKHFQAMGADGSEDIYLYVSTAPKDALDELRRVVAENKPTLVIIDTLFRLIRVRDANDYALITNALEPLVHLSRSSGCHILCVHHLGKGERSDGDAILGSTAIFGSVDTAMLLNRTENYRTLKSIQRYGSDLEESVLEFDPETRTLSLGSSKKDVEMDRIATEILGFVAKQSEPQLTDSILGAVEGRKQVKCHALKQLTESGRLQKLGRGGKNDPFRYAINSSSSVVPAQDRELGNQNPKIDVTTGNQKHDSGSQKINDATCSSQEGLFTDEVII